MSLTTSNTYITPTNTTSLGIARGQINGSLRAIMQNFYSPAAPVNTNISDDGSTVDPYAGTLYFSSNSFALYRMSASTVSGGYYSTQKFTRRGISYRVETDATSATANITSGYETGELYYRLDNNKYYFRKSDGSSEPIVSGTVVVDDGSITPVKLAAGGYLQFNTTGNVAFNNSAASSSTVRNDTILSVRNSALQFPFPSMFFEPSSHATSRHVKYDLDNWSFRQDFSGNGSKDLAVYDKAGTTARLYIDTSGRVSVGGTTSGLTSTFTVTGSLAVSSTAIFSGAAGIGGTTSPVSKLQVQASTGNSGSEGVAHGIMIITGSSGQSFWMGYDGTADVGYINAAKTGSIRPVILQSRGGTVGIGTTSPGSTLTVAGTIESTSGGVKFPDGTTQTTSAPSSFTPVVNLFTTSTTWTCPSNVTRIIISCVGGGGGGSGDGQYNYYGGGGGHGTSILTVTPGTTYTVTIGAGGAGAVGYTTASSGGESWFGINSSNKLISGTGGTGGSTVSNVNGTNGTSTGNLGRGYTSNVRGFCAGYGITAARSAGSAAVTYSVGNGVGGFGSDALNRSGYAQGDAAPGAAGSAVGAEYNAYAAASGGMSGVILLEYIV